MTEVGKAFFQAVLIEFSQGTRLRFRIFETEVAQKWASLLSTFLPLTEARTSTWIVPPAAEQARRRILMSVRVLSQDDQDRQLVQQLDRETQDSRFLEAAEQFLDKQDRRQGQSERHEVLVERLQREILSFRRSCGHRRRSSFRFLLRPPRGESRQLSLSWRDLEQLRRERLAGGIRLQYAENGKSAFECAHSDDFETAPTPMRRIEASFRVDLALSYPPAPQWDQYQELQAWAKRVGISLEDLRNWSDLLYVAQITEGQEEAWQELLKDLEAGVDLDIVKLELEARSERGARV